MQTRQRPPNQQEHLTSLFEAMHAPALHSRNFSVNSVGSYLVRVHVTNAQSVYANALFASTATGSTANSSLLVESTSQVESRSAICGTLHVTLSLLFGWLCRVSLDLRFA
eukprot:6488282-Amphidinium_carterae.1